MAQKQEARIFNSFSSIDVILYTAYTNKIKSTKNFFHSSLVGEIVFTRKHIILNQKQVNCAQIKPMVFHI